MFGIPTLHYINDRPYYTNPYWLTVARKKKAAAARLDKSKKLKNSSK